jgi:hypothetical protein
VTLSLTLALVLAATAGNAPDRDRSDYTPKETRALMYSYARCVVGREPRRAAEAILADVDNATFLIKYDRLIIGECLAQQTHTAAQMRFKGDLYHYTIADALFRREFASQAVPDLASAPAITHREPGPVPPAVDAKGRKLSKQRYEEAVEQHETQVAFAFLSRYGECVVRRAPAGAKALLLALPDSTEESAQFAALRPFLAACMPEGHTLKFGRVTLRGTIAINYYRLAHAARAGANGTAG